MRLQFILFLLLNIVSYFSLAYAQGDAKTAATPLQPVIQSEYLPPGEEITESPLAASLSDEQLSCLQFPDCGSGSCSDDSSFQFFRAGSRLQFTGWVESGLYTNAHGATSKYGPSGEGLLSNSGNGPNFGSGLRTTHYNMNQLWGRLIREMDCENGLDWGFRTDLIYGMNGYGVQSEDSFDHGWGRGDYGLGFHQLYGELGYKKLSALYGKFGTPIGWEETGSWDNFFYSHSYAFYIEPCTHTGVLVRYQLTDELKLVGGWTAGMENSFANRFGDHSLIAGLELALSEKSTFYYYMTQGKMNDSFGGGYATDFFIQSLCFEWQPLKKWTYVCQYNLNNMNEVAGERFSAFGVNNHLLYTIDDQWGVGVRAEWLRDNGILAYEDALGHSNNSDYVELTLGLNFNPTESLRIRPEIRYDHAFKNPIFANGTKKEQFSGGFAVLYGF